MEVRKCPLTYEEKRHMIAKEAFLRSEKRGASGDPVEDWLGAEAEVEEALNADCRPDREQESSAYDRMRREVRRIMEKAEETVNAENISQASKRVRQEIADSIEKLGRNWDSFRIRQGDFFAGWKERGSHSLNRTTKAIQDWLDRRGRKQD